MKKILLITTAVIAVFGTTSTIIYKKKIMKEGTI